MVVVAERLVKGWAVCLCTCPCACVWVCGVAVCELCARRVPLPVVCGVHARGLWPKSAVDTAVDAWAFATSVRYSRPRYVTRLSVPVRVAQAGDSASETRHAVMCEACIMCAYETEPNPHACHCMG